MLRESEFIHQIRGLFARPVYGLSDEKKLEIITRLSAQLTERGGGSAPEVELIPFITGRRPVDEASFPGLGSSDHVALILDGLDAEANQMYLLYRIGNLDIGDEADLSRYEVRVTLSLAGPWGDLDTDAIPGWQSRVVKPMVLRKDASEKVRVTETSLSSGIAGCMVIPISPADEFLPGAGWAWSELDEAIVTAATDGEDPFTFGHLFIQQVRAEVMVACDGVPVAASHTLFDVCDARRFGSLYRRVLEGVVKPDTAAQARRSGIAALDFAYHPWFPVLLIGSDKADLYMRALVEDIVHKQRHLTDPRWLLRVGLYLELLTCIGVFEAVRDDVGDLMTPAERRAYETSPWFREIRDAVNVEGWKHVWSLRGIVLPQVGAPRAGDVSALNLLAKRKATLAFLETHHEDLKQAIRLAGANDHNAQETWHRVFRDAERAVLRKTPDAFPELRAFSPKAQEFMLWHQKGRLGGLTLPTVSSWFGDQDGLYASACNQYRASMNHVAEWAKQQALMDHAGAECVPEPVSLLRAYMDGRAVRLGQLQRRDGYEGTIEVSATRPATYEVSREDRVALLRQVPMFRVLSEDQMLQLASSIRPIELGPVERIIVQGRPGTSLFVLAEGKLEVLIRQNDGVDLAVATLEPGAVFGEMSLLTGEKRAATVRSIDSAIVYEIGQQQLAPILLEQPSTVDDLAAMMEPRLRVTEAAQQSYRMKQEIVSLAGRIRAFLLSKAAAH